MYKNAKAYFKGKKITVMGLGLLGRALGYTKFLAECGAELIVTDLKTQEQLASSVRKLSKFSNITFVLGEHRLQDFRNRDMVIKAGGVPFDSVYLAEAQKNNIPIEMDASLFAQLAPEVTIVGITGTRGKSMTTMLVYELLRTSKKLSGRKIFLGGNIRNTSTLPLLRSVRPGDILVAELDSWQLQGFGDARISPHVSVFTTFMNDHMNYYRGDIKHYFHDKANIFKYQKKDDVCIVGPTLRTVVKKKDVPGTYIVANPKNVQDWKFIVPGEHQRDNLACAYEVGKYFGLSDSEMKKTTRSFQGVEGRLQLLRVYQGVTIINDNNATTPEATLAGLKALSKSGKKKIILICGGATKKVDLKKFAQGITKYAKFASLIPGTGTDELLQLRMKIPVHQAKNFKDAVHTALAQAKKGDTILFSPAFASFGLFNNEYERNDLFIRMIKRLK